ncbi:MAG: PstS family phosphate ABC transporter substrate-binding protein, partial [Gammaproteobacteria bacterium]
GKKADFAAFDSPYSASEFQTFLTNEGASRTQPVQLPFVAAVISIIYNNSDAPASPITLTEKKICQVFSGQVTNCRQLNASLPSKPIKVVYRGDSSGTSFAFSNHLSAVCPDADIGGGITGFKTVSTFGGTCSGATPMTCSGGTSAFPVSAPSGSIAASGNGAVTTTVASTDGAIGFADIADTAERIKLDPSIKLKFALLQRKAGNNPATGQQFRRLSPVAHPATFQLKNVLTDQVTSGIDSNGRPVKVALSNPPVAGCVLLADPDGYATAALNAAGDYATYPIVGVSYLGAGATGNGQNTRNLQAFLFSPFTQGKAGTYSEGVTTMGARSGYMYVTGLGRNMKDFITRCVKS